MIGQEQSDRGKGHGAHDGQPPLRSAGPHDDRVADPLAELMKTAFSELDLIGPVQWAPAEGRWLNRTLVGSQPEDLNGLAVDGQLGKGERRPAPHSGLSSHELAQVVALIISIAALGLHEDVPVPAVTDRV